MKPHKNYTKIAFKLDLFQEKRLLTVFLMVLGFYTVNAQDAVMANDTVVADTLFNIKKISGDAIDKQVIYTAEGYIRNDIVNKTSTLVDKAEVAYDNINITADSVIFDMVTSQVYAVGRNDSTGKTIGKPVLEIGSQKYDADTLIYNFKSGKAIVKVIVTQQDEGLLNSRVAKLMDDGTSNIYQSTYSTCDADTPHFYISLPKAKVYPGKKIISGPAHLVLEGIPLPLYLPFGYFPVQTKRAASGLIIPKPHYEAERGYALTEGGYYFALNNYFDLTLKGSLFTNGSWLLNASTTYNKRYKYNGNFSFSYAKNISGHKGLDDYVEGTNYSVVWRYSQDPKSRPGSRLSASVNMSSSGYDRQNSYELTQHITTTRQSSVSYSKTWAGTPFNFSASMNHSQNIKNKTVSLNLPKFNFSASRIYPLKNRNNAGPSKWWQELQLQYTASFDNQINTTDSLLFTRRVWDNMRTGFAHEIPVSFQIRPFRNFSISPQLSYRGVFYTQKIEKIWDPDRIDPVTGDVIPGVVRDTLKGFYYGHALNPSISASFSPQIFGRFTFTNPESRIQAIRHVMKPSVSFSFVPSFKGFSSSMYRQVQIDTLGRFADYSVFEGNIFGTPSLSQRSGNVALSLTNILEAKVFQRNDTTGKPRNIKIIDNFSINTAYNIFADSLNWAPISMVMRTTLAQNINISGGGSFTLYGLNSKGGQSTEFLYNQNKKLMRLTSAQMSIDFNLKELVTGKRGSGSARQTSQSTITAPGPEEEGLSSPGSSGVADEFDEYGYLNYQVPWSMYVSYNIQYSKPAFKSQITQTLAVNGDVSLTKNMKVSYDTGFDFTRKEITMTQLRISRDLHCWDMSFSWIPNGNMKMWEFSIKVKSSVLSDLKYERRKDYHDNF